LYLLKTKKAKTVTEAAEILTKNRVTVQDWLGKYRKGGLEKLLLKKSVQKDQEKFLSGQKKRSRKKIKRKGKI